MFKKHLMLLGLLLFSGFLIGCYHHWDYDDHHHGYGNNPYSYNSPNDPYRTGYQRGYDHGYSDRRAGYNFDYRDDNDFRYGISNDRYVNDRFRDGYVRGYQDGYYGRRGY